MSQLIRENVSLKAFNSWQVGGRAEYFAEPQTLDEIREVLQFVKQNSLSISPLGDGTNVLISDEGIKGLVLCFKKFSAIESEEIKDGQYKVVALAGTSKIDLMRSFLKKKLSPALFLSGLPGNLAGGIVMNAGVSEDRRPREFCEIVEWIEVIDFENFETRRISTTNIEWLYRNSTGWQPGLIVRAGLSWSNQPDADIPRQVIAANKIRNSKQPLDMPSCGSTFKNPRGKSAGQLIDECGLKGFQIGGAQVSEKHANFIVNVGNAKAADIYGVITWVKATVLKATGVDLEPEVKLFGNWKA